LFRSGKSKCLSSPNGDLWISIFELIVSKHVLLELEFVPSHIFDPNKQTDVFTSEFAVRHNTVADLIAEYAAGRVELPLSESTPVLACIKLVKVIQLRLHAVLCLQTSCPKTIKEAKGTVLSVQDCINLSSHSLTQDKHRLFCISCRSSVPFPGVAAATRAWLSSRCQPVGDDKFRPLFLGSASAQLGKQKVHVSHHMYLYRGVSYCNRCGGLGVQKYHKLVKQCEPPTTSGLRVVSQINNGNKPLGISCWPDLCRKNS
jgi:hypothetical protein